MATDKALLKALFEELSDFSFTDQLNMYEREDVSDAIYSEVDHIRECMEDGCQPLHPNFSKDIAKLTSHQEPLKTVVPEGQGELYQLLFILLKAHAANAANGRSGEFSGLLGRAKSIAVPLPPAQQELEDLQPFSEVFREFLDYKIKHENLSEKIQKGYERNVDTLMAIAPDKPINKITRKDIREWILLYSELPVRNKKPYKDQPVQDLLDMDIPPGDLISPKTVKEVVKMLQGVFRFSLDNDYIKVSPAVDLNLKYLHEKNSYASFTDHEVNTILEAAQDENKYSYRKWVPLLAAYTGARRGELMQLRKQDVMEDTHLARYYLNITEDAGSLKNKQSKRRIPLHNKIIEAGFLEYVEDCDDDRLFLEPAQSLTRWFTPFLEKLSLPLTDKNGNRKVFHSFRHTVVTKLKAKNIQDSLQKAVVGHEIKDTSINQTVYNHLDEAPISTFFPVIDAISYG